MSLKAGLDRYNAIVREGEDTAAIGVVENRLAFINGWYEADIKDLCIEVEDLKEQLAIEIKHNGGNTK